MCINLYYYRSISHFPFYQKPQSPLPLTASQGSRAPSAGLGPFIPSSIPRH